MNKFWATLSFFYSLADASVITPRPNIVFVLFDDIGFGQPPSYGKESLFKTPNIDRLDNPYRFWNQPDDGLPIPILKEKSKKPSKKKPK